MYNHTKEIGLSADEQLMALLNTWNSITTQEDSEYNDKLVWCLEKCQGKFRDIRYFDTRVWYFQNEKDAAMFVLRWG
jgi:hypothetical protein